MSGKKRIKKKHINLRFSQDEIRLLKIAVTYLYTHTQDARNELDEEINDKEVMYLEIKLYEY